MDAPNTSTLVESLDSVTTKCGRVLIWIGILILAAAQGFRTMGQGAGIMAGAALVPKLGPGFSNPFARLIWLSSIASTIEMVATLVALFWLMRFMVTELIPIFFLHHEHSRESEAPNMLYRAFSSLMVGFAAEAGAVVIGLIWRVIQ